LLTTAPSVEVSVGVPQASVAVAVPSAAFISDDVGLHDKANAAPVAVIAGGVVSSVQVAVLEVEEVLPHASVAVHVLVWLLAHPLLTTAPSVEVSVGVPHASVAVAVPSAALISDAVGLHNKVNADPVAVIVGGVVSSVQVAVLDADEVLPHPSVAVHVLV
jgi:hypothetical protein